MEKFKLCEKTLAKIKEAFDESYIKHMRAYASLEIANVENLIKQHHEIDDLRYDYEALLKYYTVLAYFDESERERIVDSIIPQLNLQLGIVSEIDDTACEACMPNLSNANATDIFDKSTPYFHMFDDEEVTLSTAPSYDCVTTSTDDVDDDTLEADYSQPEVRKIINENCYDKKFGKFVNYNNILKNDLLLKSDLTNSFKTATNDSDHKQTGSVKFDTTADKKNLEKYEMVQHPRHYNTYSVEVIDMFERIYGPDRTADWCEMNALKYRMRMGTKPDNDIRQDLDKEQWYLKKAKELREKVQK